MRVAPASSASARAAASQFTQLTCRVASHQSSPTSRPVEAPGAITDDTVTRRPSRHTFDISV